VSASSLTVTRSISDAGAGRDVADRWTTATIQQSGRTAKTQSRSFDAAERYATQAGIGFQSAGSYTYEPSTGRTTAVSLPLALGGTLSASYGYYPGGRLAQATVNGLTGSYAFDELGNLIAESLAGVGATSFTYDAASRLSRRDFLASHEEAEVESTYFAWDAVRGQRTSQGSSATPASHEIQMSYNAQGRLGSYQSPSTTSASYTYDAAGQRTQSVVTPAGGTTTTSTFAYEGLSLRKLSATQGAASWRIDYLTDEEERPYGAVYRAPASSTSPLYFTIVTNDRGDVLALADADGAVFAAYRYDAWGSPQGAGNHATGIWTQATGLITASQAGQIASRQILRYASYAYDTESGFYYCSARYYDPATRQWTSADPAKADGEGSAYLYCSGDPVSQVDATGQYAVKFRFPRSFSGDNTSYLRRALRLNAGQAWAHRSLGRARYAWFAYKVWPGQSWDLKRARAGHLRSWKCYRFAGRSISAEDYGNLHFGYTGNACGIPLPSLVTGGFAIHVGTTAFRKVNPFTRAAFRNEYSDNVMVALGYALYWRWGKVWQPWWKPSEYTWR
jgi:RHS repeat-associated protein